MSPRIRTGRAKVLARRHRTRSLVLLLVLDLCNLVRVLVASVVPAIVVRAVLWPPLEQTAPEHGQPVALHIVCPGVSVVVLFSMVMVAIVQVMLLVVMLVVMVVVIIVSSIERMVKVVVVVQVAPRELVLVQRLFLEQLCTATGGSWQYLWPILGRPLHQRIRIGRRVSVAEVGTVPTAANPSGHARLLDGLADHDAVLLELLR